METRIVIPELDVDSRWFDFPVPGVLELGSAEAAMAPFA